MSDGQPGALTCRGCAGAVAYGAPSCRWCGASLDWGGGIPPLPLAEPLVALDLRRDPLPDPVSTPVASPCEHGVELTMTPRTMFSGAWGPMMRSCAVSVVGLALDPHGHFGVLARRATTGPYACAYALTVHPGLRTWALSALLWDQNRNTEVKPLRMPTFAAQIAGPMQWNAVELRVAESLLEVRVNGAALETVVDGVFGYGRPGWRAFAGDQAAKVQLHAFSVHRLA